MKAVKTVSPFHDLVQAWLAFFTLKLIYKLTIISYLNIISNRAVIIAIMVIVFYKCQSSTYMHKIDPIQVINQLSTSYTCYRNIIMGNYR